MGVGEQYQGCWCKWLTDDQTLAAMKPGFEHQQRCVMARGAVEAAWDLCPEIGENTPAEKKDG